MAHMFQNPASAIVAAGGNPELIDQEAANDEFEDFYEEVFEELSKFGTVEEMNVCDNLGDHLVGNVYVKFSDEEEADSALKGLFGRWYAGRPMVPEFSPVTDFREARCRQYDDGTCGRGGQCNFMHVRYVAKGVRRYVDKIARRAQRAREGGDRDKDRSRSRSRDRRRRRSRSGSGERRTHRGDKDRSERDRSDRDKDRSERGDRDKDKDKERSSRSDRDRSDRDRSDRDRDGSRRDRDRDGERSSRRDRDREERPSRRPEDEPKREQDDAAAPPVPVPEEAADATNGHAADQPPAE